MKSFVSILNLSVLLIALGCDDSSSPYAGSDAMPEPMSMDSARPTVPTSVLVSELMASNGSSHQDENGDFDDWVELHNQGELEVELLGWRIADENDYAKAFEFTESTIIPAGGFLVIWADDEPEQGPLHATFKLSSSGETVILYGPNGEIVHQLQFPPLDADVSYGLDAENNYSTLDAPTPGSANTNSASVQ